MSTDRTLTDAVPRVLVKEKIAEAGVELLRSEFDVELGVDWDADELERRIGEFDAILIRSATKMTPELIERAGRLKVIGRAGTGVDNVDMAAATKRGIIVANAPESNSVAAAEHTLALALALCRNVPQAHGSLVAGEWARSRYGGNELYGKTLGVIGFGRIGQLVAKRAQSFEMEVVAFDKFVTPERFRELGVEGAESLDDLYARADVITLHVPNTAETEGMIGDEAIAEMRDGVRIVNCARGPLVDLDAVQRGLESGRVAGVALDVFPEEPFTEHPLFERDDVVVTPHLGASTAEAQDRAGIDTAGQVRAALTGGVVTNAVNIAAVRPEEMEALAPFVPLCEKLGRLAAGARRRGRRPGRGLVPWPDRRARHSPARDRRPGRDPLRPHGGARQPRQRADDGRGPRHRADRAQGIGLGGLHRAGHGADRRRRGRRNRGWAEERPLPGRRLGAELLHAVRRPPGDLPLRRPAGDDRQGGDRVRRARGQHRLGGRRRGGER